MTPVRLEPVAPLSGLKHSTTEPLHSRLNDMKFMFNSDFTWGDPEWGTGGLESRFPCKIIPLIGGKIEMQK